MTRDPGLFPTQIRPHLGSQVNLFYIWGTRYLESCELLMMEINEKNDADNDPPNSEVKGKD